MGEYTSIVESELYTDFPEQLKAWLESLKSMPNETNDNTIKEYKYWAEKVKIVEGVCGKDKSYQVDLDLDDHKIIEYWYDGFVMFIRDLAVFISDDGRMELDCTTDSKANLLFDEGIVTIEIAHMDWETYTANTMGKNIPDMSDELKKILLARSI
jgi:hypothetical protein